MSLQSNVWPRQAKKLRDAARGFEKSGGKPRRENEQDLRVSHVECWAMNLAAMLMRRLQLGCL